MERCQLEPGVRRRFWPVAGRKDLHICQKRPTGGQDSRREEERPGRNSADTGRQTEGHDTYDLYRRGLDLLGRGSAAAAAQLLERAAAAEPQSRSVLEALARAQFDARQYDAAAGNFRRIVDASPS